MTERRSPTVLTAAAAAAVAVGGAAVVGALAWWGPLSTRDTGRLAFGVAVVLGAVAAGVLARRARGHRRPERARNHRLPAVVGVAAAVAAVVVATVAGSAPAGAAPAYRHPRGPVRVAAATMQLTATRSQPSVVTPCTGTSGVVQVRTMLTGQATSADPRLAGDLTVAARVLLSTAGGNGFTTGTVVVRDPATGRVKVRAEVTQLETAGATKFDGLLVGTVEPGGAHLVALYSGRIDPQAGTLNANVGADTPVAPHHTAVVVGGDC